MDDEDDLQRPTLGGKNQGQILNLRLYWDSLGCIERKGRPDCSVHFARGRYSRLIYGVGIEEALEKKYRMS
jgi:hypothetical protein